MWPLQLQLQLQLNAFLIYLLTSQLGIRDTSTRQRSRSWDTANAVSQLPGANCNNTEYQKWSPSTRTLSNPNENLTDFGHSGHDL